MARGGRTKCQCTAVHGEIFVDPEGDKKPYRIFSFQAAVTALTIDDENVIVPPLVVEAWDSNEGDRGGPRRALCTR